MFQRSMGFVPLQILAIAGDLLQNTEFYKKINESTVCISLLLEKPETHTLNKKITGRWNLVKKKHRGLKKYQEKKYPVDLHT